MIASCEDVESQSDKNQSMEVRFDCKFNPSNDDNLLDTKIFSKSHNILPAGIHYFGSVPDHSIKFDQRQGREGGLSRN